jgi:hypothetical protein
MSLYDYTKNIEVFANHEDFESEYRIWALAAAETQHKKLIHLHGIDNVLTWSL